MGLVLLALLPALLAHAWHLGIRFAWQLLLMVLLALAIEALALMLRRQPLRRFLGDLSAPLSAIVLLLLLPVPTPWWMLCIALFAAIAIAKQAYGGLGDNIFNPAMVGYALFLLAFPAHFDQRAALDPWLMAGLYGIGGVFLLWRGIIAWHAPLALLGGTGFAFLALHLMGAWSLSMPSAIASLPTLVFAAFFIITDPVTGCLSRRGQRLFGAGAGVLLAVLAPGQGVAGSLPFAILLMNCAAPWIDQWTRPPRPIPAVQP